MRLIEQDKDAKREISINNYQANPFPWVYLLTLINCPYQKYADFIVVIPFSTTL